MKKVLLVLAVLGACVLPCYAQSRKAVWFLASRPGAEGAACSTVDYPDLYIIGAGAGSTYYGNMMVCNAGTWEELAPVSSTGVPGWYIKHTELDTETELQDQLTSTPNIIMETELDTANELAAMTETTGTGDFVRGIAAIITNPALYLDDCSSGLEGRTCWDATNDRLLIGNNLSVETFYPGEHASGVDPPGINTQVIFNDVTAWGADPHLTWNKISQVHDVEGMLRISNDTGQEWDQEITTIGIYDVALTNPPYPGVSSVNDVEYTRTDNLTGAFVISMPYNATAGGIQAGGISYQPQASVTASMTQAQGQQQLTSSIANVNVVANNNDVVTLVESGQYGFTYVKNSDTAETLQVYPQSGDDLGKGVNVSTTVDPGWVLECWSNGAVWWCMQWKATGDKPTQRFCDTFELLTTADDNVPFFMADASYTVVGVGCYADAAAQILIEDNGSNAVETIDCGTSSPITYDTTISGTATFTAGEVMQLDTVTESTPNWAMLCVEYTND